MILRFVVFSQTILRLFRPELPISRSYFSELKNTSAQQGVLCPNSCVHRCVNWGQAVKTMQLQTNALLLEDTTVWRDFLCFIHNIASGGRKNTRKFPWGAQPALRREVLREFLHTNQLAFSGFLPSKVHNSARAGLGQIVSKNTRAYC